MLSVPSSAPPGSVETSVVIALQPGARSRTGVSQIDLAPAGAPSKRFVAAELNATYRPSALITGVWLSAFPGELSVPTEISFVLGVHPFGAARQVSRNMICVIWFSCAENAT